MGLQQWNGGVSHTYNMYIHTELPPTIYVKTVITSDWIV